MIQQQLTIRKPEPFEAERLTDIALASKQYWGYSDEFMRQCYNELKVTREKLQAPEFQFEVAVMNNTLAGFYCLEKLSALDFEVEALFVAPEFIGQGVGRFLWQALINIATGAGAETLKIASDPAAESFYLKMGAKRIGEIPSESIAGRELPLLCVELAP